MAMRQALLAASLRDSNLPPIRCTYAVLIPSHPLSRFLEAHNPDNSLHDTHSDPLVDPILKGHPRTFTSRAEELNMAHNRGLQYVPFSVSILNHNLSDPIFILTDYK